MTLRLLPGLVLGVLPGPNPPLDALAPDPGTARDWLREELSRREYQPSLGERVSAWVQGVLDGVRSATLAAGGLSPVVALLLALVLVAAVALALSRLRRNPRVPADQRTLFDGVRQSADEHRELARQALARGDWDAAVVESTRALAAGLFERRLVAEDAGATAHEISARAVRSFPAQRDRLEAAALAFDETMYGDRPADEARARAVVGLEAELRTAAVRTGTPVGPVPAVPR